MVAVVEAYLAGLTAAVHDDKQTNDQSLWEKIQMFGLLLVPILEFGSGHHKANKLTMTMILNSTQVPLTNPKPTEFLWNSSTFPQSPT